MNAMVVGDLHLGVKNGSKLYLDTAKTLIDRVCDYATHRDIKTFIQVGDLFDNRKALTHNTIEAALDIAEQVSMTFDYAYFIVGNHDTANKDTMFPHALMIYENIPNIIVVDKPMKVGNILMLPWMFDMEDMDDAHICIGHFDINGVVMNSTGTTSRNHRLNFSDFQKYRMTISGHYHTPNNYENNIKYIGTPYQLTFNDMGSDRGFYVLNTDVPACDFVRFDWYPHHFTYTDKSPIHDDIKGHIVRLTFTEDYGIDGNRAIVEKFSSLEPLSLQIKYVNISKGMTDETISEDVMMKENIDILYDFYDKSDLPDGIEMGPLKKISESIYKEMKSV